MSNSNAHTPPVNVSEVLQRGVELLAQPVRFVGFWLSVALPLAYLPLLVGGLTGAQMVTFASLIGLHVLALFAGRNYAR